MKEHNVDLYPVVGVSGSPAASRVSVQIILLKLRIIFLFGKRNKGPAAAAAAALTCAPSATAAQLVSMLSVIEHKKGREEGGA